MHDREYTEVSSADPDTEPSRRLSESSNGSAEEENPDTMRPDGSDRGIKRRPVDVESGGTQSPRSQNQSSLSSPSSSSSPQPQPKPQLKDILINICLVLSWYFFSTSISVYNKWMFTEPTPEKSGYLAGIAGISDEPLDNELANIHIFHTRGLKRVFPFPLFTTSLHMVVQFTLALVVLYFFPKLRPSHKTSQTLSEQETGLLSNRENDTDEDIGVPPKTSIISVGTYLRSIVPCGAASGVDIGLGNMSMRFITLTFYTMCKSSVIGFALFFAFIFGLVQPTWRLCAIVALMIVGVFMMAVGETEFSAPGFALVMTAACSSGLRWALTERMMDKNSATSNPISSIFFLSPVMFVTLIILAIAFERVGPLYAGLTEFMDLHGPLIGVGALVFPGSLAFCMMVSEFAFLQRTSVVSLSIAGILKEVITFITAYLVFGDELTVTNSLGVIITIAAISWYNIMRYKVKIPWPSWMKRRSSTFPE